MKSTKRLLQEIEEEERAKNQPEAQVAVEEPPAKIVETAVPFLPAQFDPKLFAAAVGAAIAESIPSIVKAIQQSNVDPEKEKIKKMRREQMREQQRENRQNDVDKWLSCDHMRTHPYSGTARIGWAQQSDGHWRGTCMGCGCPFTPIESELPDPVRMKHLYAKYRAVPTTIARNDFLNGMVVAGNPA